LQDWRKKQLGMGCDKSIMGRSVKILNTDAFKGNTFWQKHPSYVWKDLVFAQQDKEHWHKSQQH
jgi:hypothetical protein